MANSDYKIGVVGVGRMGANIARHLTDEGFPVVAVYDADTDRNWYGIQCIDFLLIKLHIASSQDFEQWGEHRFNSMKSSVESTF